MVGLLFCEFAFGVQNLSILLEVGRLRTPFFALTLFIYLEWNLSLRAVFAIAKHTRRSKQSPSLSGGIASVIVLPRNDNRFYWMKSRDARVFNLIALNGHFLGVEL
jgi:hypothetical protein